MVTSYNKPTMPYDTAFTEGMSRLDRAKSDAESRPVDYARRGGGALLQRGEMYPAMYATAMRMAANRRSAEQDREIAWSRAAARKKALADKMTAQAVSSAVSGIGGLGMDFLRRGVKMGQKEGDKASFGDKFEPLLEGGNIREVMRDEPTRQTIQVPGGGDITVTGSKPVGTGTYRHTPKGAFEEMHRGPYWWETPGSTGGF